MKPSLAALSALLLCSHAAAAEYEVTWIAPDGSAYSHYGAGMDINGDGTVAGYFAGESGGADAFVWSAAAGLRFLEQESGLDSTAYSINDAGVVVGYTSQQTGANRYTQSAYRYQEEELAPLPLKARYRRSQSYATDVNGDGAVSGYLADQRGTMTPFLISAAGKFKTLPLPKGLSSAAADGVGDDGTAVGRGGYLDNLILIWRDAGTAGATVEKVAVAGTTSVFATHINNCGTIAVTAAGADYNSYPLVYRNGALTALWNDPNRGGYANGINDYGAVVGFYWDSTTYQSAPYLYSDGTVQNLNDLIPAGSGTLETAYGINNRGEIVGSGSYNGQRIPFVLRPVGMSEEAAPAGRCLETK